MGLLACCRPCPAAPIITRSSWARCASPRSIRTSSCSAYPSPIRLPCIWFGWPVAASWGATVPSPPCVRGSVGIQCALCSLRFGPHRLSPVCRAGWWLPPSPGWTHSGVMCVHWGSTALWLPLPSGAARIGWGMRLTILGWRCSPLVCRMRA